ncbi:MAG: MBL fold metallo-hydrolase [Proteobacteria bacterium]|nr:MBL fold metallo-hydrolase [Pseudomonadota bacterium]
MAREHIDRWKIGDVEVVRIVEIFEATGVNPILFQDCGHERALRHPWLVPNYATAEGALKMNFQAFALRAGNRRIMVDTCIGNDKHRQAAIFHHLQSTFLDDLTYAGFPPESIDTVLCTHLHLDHVGWNTRLVHGKWMPTFPNARYLFNRKEWDFIHGLVGREGAEVDHLPDSLQPVYEAGLIDFVSTDHQVTPEVGLEPTPGHTPGHVSVRIESEGKRAVITGDIMHHPVQCAEPDLQTNFCNDHEQAIRTRRGFLRRYQDRGAYVIGSHFCDPTGGWIVSDGDAWRFEGEQQLDS